MEQVRVTPSITTGQRFSEGRPFTHEGVVVHRVFRRASALSPRLVRSVPDGGTARAERWAVNVREYLHGAHIHRRTEGRLIWPLLRVRADHYGLVARMQEQRGLIGAGLAAVTRRLPGWERTEDRAAGEPLAAALDDEEDVVLPLVAERLTAAEWALDGERGLEQIPRPKRMLALGAVLEDATDQEAAFFLGRVPAVGRLLWRVVGRRQYAALRRERRGQLHQERSEQRS
jgi:hypothetical protein